jgi:hypothetical protein
MDAVRAWKLAGGGSWQGDARREKRIELRRAA